MENIASIGKRIMGGIIDIIILMLFAFVYNRFFGAVGAETKGGVYHISGWLIFIMYVIVFLYFIILEATTGKTVGKYIVKTKVVNKEGNILSWPQAVIRNIMRIIDGFAFYIVALIAMLISRKNQRLGDMLAKTYVIND
jgi:uncharacterized RDD family membrane protein YckC